MRPVVVLLGTRARPAETEPALIRIEATPVAAEPERLGAHLGFHRLSGLR